MNQPKPLTALELERLDHAKKLAERLKDHALKSRLTKDDILAYRFSTDFVPHIIAYGDARVVSEVKHSNVENHKLNVKNRQLQARVAELEAALKQYESLNDKLFDSSNKLYNTLMQALQDNEAEVQLTIKSLEESGRDGKLG